MGFIHEMYKLGLEISPVILYEGIAQAIPGGTLLIVAPIQSASFVTGLLGGTINLTNPDKCLYHWKSVQDATIIDHDIARYPFAGQIVAANTLLV